MMLVYRHEDLENEMSLLVSERDNINARIKELQKMCKHPERYLEKVNKSNTGNYDPGADSYWTEFYCTCCDKRWREYQ